MAKSTNLKTDSIESKTAKDIRKATLNFISVTPRQLIEKEGREQKAVKVNVFAKTTGRDLLGQKEDFRFEFSRKPFHEPYLIPNM